MIMSFQKYTLGVVILASLFGCTGSVDKARDLSLSSLQKTLDTRCAEGKCPCPSPLGLIAHGGQALAYEHADVACNETCEAHAVTLTCDNGKFDRDETQLSFSCQVKACRTCTVGANSIPTGFALMMYSTSTVTCLESCADKARSMICRDGVLQGTPTGPSPDGKDSLYGQVNCTPSACMCALPSGGSVTLNTPVQFYKSATGTCDKPCDDPSNVVSMTCKNTGTNANPIFAFDGPTAGLETSCSNPARCKCTLPDDNQTVIESGSSQKLYSQKTSINCSGCSTFATTVYCDAGVLYNKPASDVSRQVIPTSTLSGLKNLTCDDAGTADCRVNGICIANGYSKTLYSKSSLACGDDPNQFQSIFSCANSVVTKDGNAYDSKTDSFASAWIVNSPTSTCGGCTLPWGVQIPVNTSVTGYRASSASSNSCGNGCKSFQLTCTSVGGANKLISGDPGIDADIVANPANWGQTCANVCNEEGGGAPPRACLLPWQNSYVTPDALIPMYDQKTVSCGDTCQNHFVLGRCQLSTGTFDAGLNYRYQSCTEIPCSQQALKLTGVSPATTPLAGGSITLSGTGFQSTTQVLIGDQPCQSISVASPSQLSCRVPAGVGVRDITVKNGAIAAVLPKGLRYSCVAAGGTRTFTYAASAQQFTLPPGCAAVTVKAWGGGGGGGGTDNNPGGSGGFAMQTFNVPAGSTLSIYVGGGGRGGGSLDSTTRAGGTGYASGGKSPGAGFHGGGGGGASAVVAGSDVLLVAGGGGGGGGSAGWYGASYGRGGAGGGVNGTNGTANRLTKEVGNGGQSGNNGGRGGSGITQKGQDGSAANGQGGDGGGAVVNLSGGLGGGGGGGYAGGGGGGSCNQYCSGGGGGGGSSYIHTSAAAGASVILTGSGPMPANRTDADYRGGIAVGGTSTTNGGNGVVIVSY